jgi:hypothetical protein
MKLEGPSNYILWAFKFQNICEHRDLWDVVAQAAVFLPDNVTDEKIKTTNDLANTKIRKFQSKARLLFQLSVRDHLLVHIIRLTCPYAMFQVYKSVFSDASEDRRQLLQLKLTNLEFACKKQTLWKFILGPSTIYSVN